MSKLYVLCVSSLAIVSLVESFTNSPITYPTTNPTNYPGANVHDIGTSPNIGHQPLTSPSAPVTDVCLGCMCEAITGCDRSRRCTGDICGVFAMTWAYWSDGGKPTLFGTDPLSANAFSDCANDPFCAAQAIQGYMNKYAQDCNGDGLINCLDYAAIHLKGGYGCKGELPPKITNTMNQCLASASQGGAIQV